MSVLWIALAIVVAVQFFYFVLVFTKLAYHKVPKVATNNQAASVIICCKNELANLKTNLDLFLTQDYPNFEVVVINDCSTDGTKEYLEEKVINHKPLKVVTVEPNETFWSNKKYALTLGIKAAKNDLLLFADADCQPASNQWLKSMVNLFSDKKDIVLGYSPYLPNKSLLNYLIRFETVMSAIQYFSWALFSKPYMGVGRNLAYKKSLFFKKNGFINHIKVRSGDDDLFINETANKNNTQININPESYMQSIPKTTWKDWIYQKRRHITTAKYYKWSDKLKLGLFYVSQVLFFILLILNLLLFDNIIIAASIIVFRYLFVLLSFGFASHKIQEAKLTWLYVFLEPILIIIQFHIFVRNLISKPTLWK
jgi:glycosyltransferase involved in cell wall biosynthesis